MRGTRQRILDAAQRLIEAGGFSRLTTKEIAREAECAEGTIFKHFARKEDLALAVVLENAPHFKQTLSGKRGGEGSLPQNLEDVAREAIRFSDKLIPLAAAIFADSALLTRHRQALGQGGGPKEAFDLIAGYVSEEQQSGRISLEAVPLMVSAVMIGSCFYWAFIRQMLGHSILPLSDREFSAGLVAILTRGLSTGTGLIGPDASAHAQIGPKAKRGKRSVR
jgi:AcrR family transcriptional regulator